MDEGINFVIKCNVYFKLGGGYCYIKFIVYLNWKENC